MPTQKSTISYAQSNYFSKLILEYISGSDKLNYFYNAKPEIASFSAIIEAKSKETINRNLLYEVIDQQYKNGNCTVPNANLQLLSQENTFTVTTGHQLCLFTGPLYFIYKIISTINLAEALKANYPNFNFVPFYWMASEDHDFAEVNHIHVFGKKIEFNPTMPTSSIPVGKISTEGIQVVLDEIKSILGESESAKQLVALFDNAYKNSKNLADATRILVHSLFGHYGLVVLDADDARLKKEFASIMLDDIKNQSNHKLVNESISKLEEQGFKAQVNPRGINCFYMKDSFRERIIFEADVYKINNTELVFNASEMETELQNFPERFSPNVVLRPLYQEKILPNLAYIGGGGELAYWLEYKSMFEFHNIPFPVLLLRNSLLWIDKASADKWQKFSFGDSDYFLAVDELIKSYMAKNSDDINLMEEQENIKSIFASIAAKAQKKDPTLKASADAELQKALSSLSNLENKMLKAEKQKQETSLNQLKKIKEKLFPAGELQERYDNLSNLYLKHGNAFIQEVKDNLNPLDVNFTLLMEK